MSPQCPAPTYDTLVLSGGGPEGIAFIGCVSSLESAGALRRLRTVVGCSAGAIVALFVALGMTAEEMRAWMLQGVSDRSLVEVDIEGVLSIADRLGVDDGERVVEALRGAVRSKMKGAEDATFVELAKATGRGLVVCVSNLEDARQELLSVDTAPDLSVLTAVRMSISVPILFTPVRYRGRTYVDGAVFEHCPTSHIAASGAATSTLALRIINAVDPPGPPPQQDGDDVGGIGGIASYAWLLARALMVRIVDSPPPIPKLPQTQLTVVDITSLDPPACRFSLSSLSLCIDEDGIDRYVRHGASFWPPPCPQTPETPDVPAAEL